MAYPFIEIATCSWTIKPLLNANLDLMLDVSVISQSPLSRINLKQNNGNMQKL